MQKKILLLTIAVLCSFSAFSQKVISGKITAADEPAGVPGASVFIKGNTQLGTISDLDGNYALEVPTDTGTLVISYMGYNTQEINIQGKSVINIELKSSSETLDELVVTALGIKREEKALGYSVQKVGGEDIAQVKEMDIINSLSGKVSGVNIIQGSGAIGGGGSRIVIRGESSLAGYNTPLYIIDGIEGNYNDVASDDVESISILKGPAAAALYGSKAAPGVIMITTKSGKNQKGMQIEVNSNITFQSPLVLPDYQNEYGQGSGGSYSYYNGCTNDEPYWDDSKNSWGPQFDGELRSQFNGQKAWKSYKDNVKDFYETGHVFINNVSIANSSEKGNYRFSYTNTDQKGIMPNNGLNKNNFNVNSQFKFKKWLTLSTNLTYIRTQCDNNREVDVRFTPRSIDISALQDYWIPGMEGEQQLKYRQSENNPYFTLYESPTWYTDNKVIANISANIEIAKELNLMGRFSTDYTNNEYYEKHGISTYNKYEPRDAKGYYKSGLANTWNRNADFLLSYEKNFNNIFKAKISAGGAHRRSEYKKIENSIYEILYKDIENLRNTDGYVSIDDEISKKELNSLYAFLNLEYKGRLFLDITRRDDWCSTLHPSVNHYTYYSFVASALLTEFFELPDLISFWKIRGGIAQAGAGTPTPYFTVEKKYSLENNTDGTTRLDVSNIETDPYLKPEMTDGYELGTDIRLFENRLGIDVTYYYNITKNQIVKIKRSESAGGRGFYTTNVGKVRSQGLEISINATPIKTKDFSWDTQINWSYDRSYIEDFVNGSVVKRVNAHLAIENRKDQRLGTFYGKSYQRAPNGKRLYSLSGDTRLTEETQLGNYNPDWMASTYNTLSYKGLSLSFLFDLRWGGLIFNETERKLNMYGLAAATTLNNREGMVPDGMVEEEDGTYRELTLADLEAYGKTGGQTGQEYWANQMEEAAPECVLVDDTYLKLRELRLAYQLPQKWIKKTPIKSMTIALVGRNLAVWTKVKHTDPEVFGEASDNNDFGGKPKIPGYANNSTPSVRNYGFTVNCKF